MDTMDTMEKIISAEEKIMYKNGKHTIADILSNVGEANTSFNDLQRKKIKVYAQLHNKCYLGKYNDYENEKTKLVEYKGQQIYNFDYDFILPEINQEVIKLLELWKQTSNSKYIDKLYDKITNLKGIFLFWS